jgi:hypothetical protein
MIAKSTRYAVCFGLAGSFAVAIAPAVRAQIQVTGGRASGQAAFFVPTPGGSRAGQVELFDVGISRLRLETRNGNTSTAAFTPTAASFKAGSDNEPNSGDKGTIRGLLSGIAFSSRGTPIPFSNRQTLLNFTLNRFDSNLGEINGTLISPDKPGDAALVFLPNVNATLASGSSFDATRGDLKLGDFEADLNTGLIDLPSSYLFRNSGNPIVTPVNLARRIKFTFEGEDVLPQRGTDFNVGNNNSGSIRFVGEANKKFQIQSVGTRESDEFKIDGTFGAVDITIRGPFDIKSNERVNENRVVDKYKIEGESNGFTSLFASNSVGFSGTARRDTKFKFEQGNNTLEGRSDGNVNFYAVAGTRSFNRDTQFTNYKYTTFDDGGSNTTAICNICSRPALVNDSTIVVGSTNVTVGSPIIINPPSDNTSTTNTLVTSNTSTFTVNALNVNVFSLTTAFTSSTARFQYQVLTAGNDISVSRIRNRVRLVERGGNRYYIVSREGGTSSIVSPGGSDRQQGRDDDDSRNNRQQGRDDDDDSRNNRQQGRDDDDSRNNRQQGRDDDDDSRNNRQQGRDDDSASNNSDQTAYQLVGPSSRCFPGLVGLRQIPPGEVAKIENDNRNETATTSNLDNDTAAASDTTVSSDKSTTTDTTVSSDKTAVPVTTAVSDKLTSTDTTGTTVSSDKTAVPVTTAVSDKLTSTDTTDTTDTTVSSDKTAASGTTATSLESIEQ